MLSQHRPDAPPTLKSQPGRSLRDSQSARVRRMVKLVQRRPRPWRGDHHQASDLGSATLVRSGSGWARMSCCAVLISVKGRASPPVRLQLHRAELEPQVLALTSCIAALSSCRS